MSYNSPLKITTEDYAHENLTGTVAAPTNTEAGHHTRNHEQLHIAVEDVGASVDVALYVRYPGSAEWFLFEDFGTSGVRQFTADAYVIVPIYGVEAVFAAIPAITGAGANVWLGANSAQNER